MAAAAVTAAVLMLPSLVATPSWAVVPNPFDPVLDASPAETVVPARITVTGSCPAINVDPVESDQVYEYPSSATLSFPAAGVKSEEVALDSGGEFRESFVLPGTLTPGQYPVGLSCFEGDNWTEDLVTVLPPPEPVRPVTLTLDPPSGEVGERVTATGTCPLTEDRVALFFDGGRVPVATGDLSETGEFDSLSFTVPDAAPGEDHRVDTSCGAAADFEVLPAEPVTPTLELDPVTGRVGDDVTATGTCPVSSERVTVLFGGRSMGSDDVDPESGAFGPVPFTVPDVDAGTARVTTDCGAGRDFEVLTPTAAGPSVTPETPVTPGPSAPAQPGPPVTPGTPAGPSARPAPTTAVLTETPEGLLVLVPDLRGMTEGEALEALGPHLTLVPASTADGEIRRQDPAPGSLVAPASAVTVEMDPDPAFPWLLVGALLVAAVVAGLVTADRVRRRRLREERWLEEQVRTELRPQSAVLSVVPDRAVPGVDLRLEVHRHPARL